MKTYTAFFNAEPQIGTVVVDITAGLEVARANGSADVDDETIFSKSNFSRPASPQFPISDRRLGACCFYF